MELNFVPSWARKSASENPFARDDAFQNDYRERPRRNDRNGGPRRKQRQDDRQRRPKRPREERPHGKGHEGGTHHQDRRDSYQGQQSDRQEYAPRHREERPRHEHIELPLTVHFIPDRAALRAVVQQIRQSSRAYPLFDLAGLFLDKQSHYAVKVEFEKDSDPEMHFYQCEKCKTVRTDRESLLNHILADHLSDYFDVEEIEVEPPKGKFSCVGRCPRTKELLGPPNYHSFNERLVELHREHFSRMPLDRYRATIEMVHEEEVVEQWRDSCRKQTVYQLKVAKKPVSAEEAEGAEGAKEADKVENMTAQQADVWLRQNESTKLIHESRRIVIPGPSAQELPPGPLRHAIRRGWGRESRHPFTLAMALRPAFRHMGLFTFKAGDKITFVTAIHPKPMDAEHAEATLHQVLEYLAENPGINRSQLVDALVPGVAHDTKEALHIVSPLRWLIDRGHVVEFFNGKLSVPGHLKNQKH